MDGIISQSRPAMKAWIETARQSLQTMQNESWRKLKLISLEKDGQDERI